MAWGISSELYLCDAEAFSNNKIEKIAYLRLKEKLSPDEVESFLGEIEEFVRKYKEALQDDRDLVLLTNI